MPAMLVRGLIVVFTLALSSCTSNVSDQKAYARCFLDRECDPDETDGCFQLTGDAATLGICSVFCGAEACPGDGACSTAYVQEDDTGTATPICLQPCGSADECPAGGFVCSGGSCVPP